MLANIITSASEEFWLHCLLWFWRSLSTWKLWFFSRFSSLLASWRVRARPRKEHVAEMKVGNVVMMTRWRRRQEISIVKVRRDDTVPWSWRQFLVQVLLLNLLFLYFVSVCYILGYSFSVISLVFFSSLTKKYRNLACRLPIVGCDYRYRRTILINIIFCAKFWSTG